MYLHLGQNTVVWDGSIIGVFDLDNSSVGKHTKNFLLKAQQEDRIVNVSSELPKSFVVCDDNGRLRVYLSQMNAMTLLKRSRESLNRSARAKTG